MKTVMCPACGIKFPPRTNYTNPIYEQCSSHQVEVEKFMTLGGQEVPSKPTIPSLEVRKLRAKLILEEALETIHALGLKLHLQNLDSRVCPFDSGFNYEFKDWHEPNLVNIADGCCDLRVVTTGTLSACGIKDLRPQEIVDSNNLEKFKWTFPDAMKFCEKNEGHTWEQNFLEPTYAYVKRNDGKIIKPPSHKPPNLEMELKHQGM